MTTNVFFTSDSHFFHGNVIKYSQRPFDSVEEMNESLVFNWNSTVGKNDTVYHLGDLFLIDQIDKIESILSQLNGRIRLIAGNHDKWVKKLSKIPSKNKIEWVKDYFEHSFMLDGEKVKISMLHYPMHSWNKSHFGSYCLHGHCHGSLDETNKTLKRLDVGVDSHNYTPLSLEKVHSILKDPNRGPRFHH